MTQKYKQIRVCHRAEASAEGAEPQGSDSVSPQPEQMSDWNQLLWLSCCDASGPQNDGMVILFNYPLLQTANKQTKKQKKENGSSEQYKIYLKALLIRK